MNILKLNLKSIFNKAECFSIIYLSLPYILFFYGWYRLEISIPLMGLFIYGICKIIFSIGKNSLEDELERSNDFFIYQFLVFAAAIGFWLYFAGVGGFFYQNGDYVKHNGMFYDLSQLSWPVKYLSQDGKIEIPLVYYVGYHLPCAFVMYLFGIDIGEYFIYFWTFAGVFLGFLLFINNLKKINTFFVFLFMIFSGLDILGLWIVEKRLPNSGEHIEWWAKVWQYPANTTSLFWVPQHFIPSLILACLIFKYFYDEKKNIHLTAISVLGILWSPFVSIGIFPFIIFNFFKTLNKQFIKVNFIFVIVLLMLLTFFSSGWYKHPSGFIINLSRIDYQLILFYSLFISLEFLIYLILISDEFLKDKKILLVFSVITLFVLPSYKFGYYNDLVMRASLPSIMFLQIFIFRNLEFSWNFKFLKTVLILFLISIGSMTAVMEFQRGLNLSMYRVGYSSIINMSPNFTVQYLGKENWFWINLAKKNDEKKIRIPNELNNFLNKLGYFY